MKKGEIIGTFIFLILAAGIFFYLSSHPQAPMRQNENNSNETANNTNTMDNGLKIETIKEGTGEGAKSGDKISVHYIGTLSNGTKFDSSRDRKTPFGFQLGAGAVIQGWDQGLIGMKVGEIRKLTIPPNLGYGQNGVPGAIPANAVLIFEVELLKIN